MERKICLNGLWDFSGQSEGPAVLPAVWEETKIKVPSPYNVNAFAGPRDKRIGSEPYTVYGGDFVLYPEYPEAWGKLTCGFYRRYIDISEESRGKRLFLRFEGLSYHSCVYVNGHPAAEEMEGFLPIEMEITPFVRFGEKNEIVVGAQKAKSLIYKDSAGRNRLDYPIGSFWGEHIGGIWQDVWLIERPETYLADVFALTDVRNRKLTVRYETAGEDITDSDRIEVVLTDPLGQSRVIADGVPAVRKGTVSWEYEDGDISLWEIESPALYQLSVRLYRDGRAISEFGRRIGFRTFEAGTDCFYLNGRPIKLAADAWHYMGYSVQTPEYARSYYRMAREAGVNIIRLHAQPWPEFFYDIADEMGMLIVCESAIWASHCNFSYSDFFFENSRKHLRRLIVRDRSHPSIVMWSPENECVPAYHVCGSQYVATTEELEDKIYDLICEVPKLDPSRIISCDGSGDLKGRLKVNSLHYPGYDCPVSGGKPITIGEMGSMYYSTPDTLCMDHGEAPLESMEERLKAVAADAYHNLMGERRWAAQVCVFNLIWYGLRPYPFREKFLRHEDLTEPGIHPSRVTPYLRTLNAGAEPGEPEYYPNPVFEMAKQAYAPVRFYLEDMPESIWKDEKIVRRLYLFHDRREAGTYRFAAVWRDPSGERILTDETLALEPCSVRQLELAVADPGSSGEACLDMSLKDCQSGEIVWQEQRGIRVYEKERYWEQAQGFAEKAVVCEGEPEERKLPAVFCAGEEIRFREPVPYRVIPYERYRNGQALYFDGEGNAVVAVARRGSKQILCGVDLTRIPGTEGIRLAASLTGGEEGQDHAVGADFGFARADLAGGAGEQAGADRTREQAGAGGDSEMTAGASGGGETAAGAEEKRNGSHGGTVILCEDEDGGLERSLRAVGCRFRKVPEDELGQTIEGARTGKLGQTIEGAKPGKFDQTAADAKPNQADAETDALLILGRGKTHLLNSEKTKRFRRILVAAGETGVTGIPGVSVKPEKIYHFSANDEIKRELGIYGLHLYGLERNQEQVLAEHVMDDPQGRLEKLIFLPGIDWRMWNNDPEEIKTVSALRSELEDRSSFCVLGRRSEGQRTVYYSTLGTDPGSSKQRYLWERLLSSFGAVFGGGEDSEQTGTDHGGSSGDGVPEYMMNVLK